MSLSLRIRGWTRWLGQPVDWKDDENGPCTGLPIRDETINGTPFMISAHELTPDELAALQEGKPLLLGISGYSHPVIFLHVGDWKE